MKNVTLEEKPAFEAFMRSQVGDKYGGISTASYTRAPVQNRSAYIPLMYNSFGPELPALYLDLLQTVDVLEIEYAALLTLLCWDSRKPVAISYNSALALCCFG